MGAILLAGCGPANSTGSPDPTAAATSSVAESIESRSPASLPQDGAARCGVPDLAPARGVRIRTDRAELFALTAGAGERGVLLIHGSGTRGVCVWPKEIPALAAAGYQVLAIDHACVGESDCPTGEHDLVADIAAGARHLRNHGARTVVVVGASAGTAEVTVSAATRTVPLTAAVALSPVGLDRPVRPPGQTPRTAREAAARIRVPILYIVAADDTVSSTQDTQALYAATPPKHRSILDLPRGGHAQQLLAAGDEVGGPVYDRFLAFVRRHSGG